MADRGVSEVVGYVIAFGIIAATVAVVFTVGVGTLTDTRSDTRLTAAERSFDTLARDVDAVALGGVPERTTVIRSPDGRVGAVNGSVTITVRAGSEVVTVTPAPVVYADRTGRRIVYVGGAVLREEGDRSVMTRRPSLVTNASRVALPVIDTVDAGGAATSDAARVRSTLRNRTVRNVFADTDAAFVNVTSPRAAAWNRSLDRLDGVDCSRGPSANRTSCRVDVGDTAAVTRATVAVGVGS
jgi:hypothetical protein